MVLVLRDAHEAETFLDMEDDRPTESLANQLQRMRAELTAAYRKMDEQQRAIAAHDDRVKSVEDGRRRDSALRLWRVSTVAAVSRRRPSSTLLTRSSWVAMARCCSSILR
ncbi:hypothetical protein SDRG_13504 [Saprolegnia diclina VS20]|uniref:Uncharacterized protein n=1 Tax=Saprolegnia diclina (strain VS20) TaxID=1156394 RepID=T0R9K5_SAPDV|nr:hypothetical protein SDRG_13504 [Saprolegnia diclina VS20]EQC28823.1 hypothetical protein SDRG_13504 [Saprolegnia diclina VS20]|eukprot:XP_008617818.1 hypothetical protein SDRG_13504 [Saprolegnia diclina VS20]